MIKLTRITFLLMLIALAGACTPGGAQVEATLQPTEVIATIMPAPVPTEAPTQPVEPTAEATAEVTATVEATPAGPISDTLEEFISDLQLAISAQDFDTLQSFMSDPFSVGYWMSEGVSYSPEEAAEFLGSTLLAEDALVTWADPGTDLTSMLQGQPPETFLGPDKQVAAALLSYGWGEDGTAEAIQFITEQPDGSYQWELMLYSGFGFLGWPTDVEAVLINADEATFYSGPGETYDPVATVFGGMTYPVVGVSQDQEWWRLRCYDDNNALIPQCWVSADAAVSSPTTAP